MANTVKMKGFFGRKQAFNVTAATITSGWAAGQLFRFIDAPNDQAGSFKYSANRQHCSCQDQDCHQTLY